MKVLAFIGTSNSTVIFAEAETFSAFGVGEVVMIRGAAASAEATLGKSKKDSRPKTVMLIAQIGLRIRLIIAASVLNG